MRNLENLNEKELNERRREIEEMCSNKIEALEEGGAE